MATTVRVDGLRELDRALGELPKATGKNVLRRTLRKVAEPIANDMKAKAPDDPATGAGDLKSAIAVSTKSAKHAKSRKADKALVEVYVGVSTDTQFRKHHGVFQEFGTAQHSPQPFLRPAWDENKAQTLEKIKTDLWTEIEKAAARLAKKAAR